MINRQEKRAGFTVLELVIVIIALIILGVIVFSINN